MEDLYQEVWDQLRENGHVIGTSFIQEKGGQLVVVDGVAMSLDEAKAVAQKRVTVSEIASAREKPKIRPEIDSIPVHFCSRCSTRPKLTFVSGDVRGNSEWRCPNCQGFFSAKLFRERDGKPFVELVSRSTDEVRPA